MIIFTIYRNSGRFHTPGLRSHCTEPPSLLESERGMRVYRQVKRVWIGTCPQCTNNVVYVDCTVYRVCDLGHTHINLTRSQKQVSQRTEVCIWRAELNVVGLTVTIPSRSLVSRLHTGLLFIFVEAFRRTLNLP